MATAHLNNEVHKRRHHASADPGDFHEAMVAGQKLYQAIKEGKRQVWSDYLELGRICLVKARAEALCLTGANRPSGHLYTAAMSRLLKDRGLGELAKDKTVSRLLNIMDNLAAVEEWRGRQRNPDDLNHPSWVWKQYRRSLKSPDQKKRVRAQPQPQPKPQPKKKVKLQGHDIDLSQLSAKAREAIEAAEAEAGDDYEGFTEAQILERMKDSLVIMAGQAVDCVENFQSILKDCPDAISQVAIDLANKAAKKWEAMAKTLHTIQILATGIDRKHFKHLDLDPAILELERRKKKVK